MKAGHIAGLVALALSLVGCGGPSREPGEVAEAFWLAVLAEDLDGVRAISTEETAAELDLAMLELNATVTFGDTVEGDGAATVATQLQDPGGAEPAVEVPTVLTLEDGEWRVDATQTLEGARRELVSGVAQDIRQLGEEIRQELEAAVQELRKEVPELRRDLEALGQVAQELRESLNEQVPVLQQEVDELLLALQEILETQGEEPSAPDEEQP